MRLIGLIPARYGSTRFPGKPLADIFGKSMIQRVVEQASASSLLAEVWVATDDRRIYDHVKTFGGHVLMTSPDHLSGTDRCREALELHGGNFDAVINIQGDEPFIQPSQIDRLVRCFDDPAAEIATLVKKIEKTEVLHNPHKVKVVRDRQDYALYFSRQAIPFQKDRPQEEWLRTHTYYQHIGIYGYRSHTLQKISALEPGILETAESLEQLRWLENGFRIKTALTDEEAFAIDTPEDLKTLLTTFGK